MVCGLVSGWFSDNFNFCCIICLYFGISNLKIYPVYTNSFKYIFPDLNTYNAQFGIFTSFWRLFLYKSDYEMSSPSHTCICLQIINWLSYLHTKTAQMLLTWQYKSHPKKKNSMHRLYWNIQHSFQNFPKKNWRVRQFFHCDTNTYISLILLLMQIIVIIRGKTLPSNKSQNRESVTRKVPKIVRKM